MSSRRAWSVLCCPPARCKRAAQVRRDVPPCRNAARARRVRGARRCAYYAIAAASAHGQAHMLFSSDYLGATSDVVRMDAASAPLLPARAAGMAWARRRRLNGPRRLYMENRAVCAPVCAQLCAPRDLTTTVKTPPSPRGETSLAEEGYLAVGEFRQRARAGLQSGAGAGNAGCCGCRWSREGGGWDGGVEGRTAWR